MSGLAVGIDENKDIIDPWKKDSRDIDPLLTEVTPAKNPISPLTFDLQILHLQVMEKGLKIQSAFATITFFSAAGRRQGKAAQVKHRL